MPHTNMNKHNEPTLAAQADSGAALSPSGETRTYNLPDGSVSCDAGAYCVAWDDFCAPLTHALGWALVSLDPGVSFGTGGGERLTLTVRQARDLTSALACVTLPKKIG